MTAAKQRRAYDKYRAAYAAQLVSWRLVSIFSTNMAISEMKGRGWSYLYPVREG